MDVGWERVNKIFWFFMSGIFPYSSWRFQSKCRANGERVHANPIYRCLEPERGQEGGGAFSEGESTDGEMLMAGWEDKPLPPDGEVSTTKIMV